MFILHFFAFAAVLCTLAAGVPVQRTNAEAAALQPAPTSSIPSNTPTSGDNHTLSKRKGSGGTGGKLSNFGSSDLSASDDDRTRAQIQEDASQA